MKVKMLKRPLADSDRQLHQRQPDRSLTTVFNSHDADGKGNGDEEQPLSAPQGFRPVVRTSAEMTGKLPRKRVMICDDESSVRESLARVLKTEDYDVVGARDGRDAVSKFIAVPCDLVLMDLNMPQLDGWEALEWITRMRPMIPVILITARPNQYERAACSGIDALMEKPLDFPLLLRTIAELLAEPEADRMARLTNRNFTTTFLSGHDHADPAVSS
ncbi:MAG TPA: response regulator [Verrucomicrobiae bacterium]|jgi:CheY-like chemotaxis protein